MIITFDRNLETQRSLSISFFNEQILERRLMAGKEIVVSGGTVFPDISSFIGDDRSFSTVEIFEEGNSPIPIAGTYNMILNLSVNYSELTKAYNLNLSLGYSAE